MNPGVCSMSLKDFQILSTREPPRTELARRLGYAETWIADVIAGTRQTPELEKILGIWKQENKGENQNE